MRAHLITTLLLATLVLSGCSDGGSDAPAPNAAHPDGWIATHDAEALASPNYADCVSCHGTDLKGSGGVVSCYLCHVFNTLPPLTVHPVAWTDPYVDHRNYALANGYPSCAVSACHGTGEIPQGGETAPSCATASYDGRGCHSGGPGGAPHVLTPAWLLPSGTVDTSHVLASIANSAPCIGCHTLTGGGIEPACSRCHTANDPNYSVGTCASCHNNPPDSSEAAGGAVRPNREGAHSEHRPATMHKGDCGVCHSGSGTNTLNHYDDTVPADTSFLVTFNAKTGSAGYSAAGGTCSNVSCHGGQTTSAWLTGTIDVNSACSSCHELGGAAQTPQYNSYYSGYHNTHVSRTACVTCHDVAKLAPDHFIGLDTSAFEGDPALSMAAAIGYDAVNSTCTTNLAGCHQGVTRGWTGGGGAPHPVNASWLMPSGTTETSHVLASIANSAPCITCHTTTGCRECHTANNPNYSLGTCDSCHSAPPDSSVAVGGNTRPNREGAHSEHDPLTTHAGDCSACHNGSGTNTLNHYDTSSPASMLFLATYNAKTGSADYSVAAGTCSNVSCHGGQTTPAWLTGSIDVNSACSSCHELGSAAQTPQYNSYYSGYHGTHVTRTACVTCHDTTKLAVNHLSKLDTQAMEGPASATIADAIGYVAANSTCTTNLAGCHQGVPRSWTGDGGAPHPVNASWLRPSGTTSTSHVLAALAATPPASTCLGCHSLTGGGTATACNTCHAPDGPNLVLGTCNSCHAEPPDSVVALGNTRPNREGAHSEHDPFTSTKQDCAVCHNGSGTDTLSHYDTIPPADVDFWLAYNAKSGAASFSPATLTCSNVSCHGGQTTPNWLTGALNSDTQCGSCHQVGTTQYNSYTNPDDKSHTYHIGRNYQGQTITCAYCHNIINLAPIHFNDLDTTIMNQASQTIGGGSTFIESYIPSTRSCTPVCHSQENW